MKIVFIDCEFTGEHAFATLVSVGMVTLDGRELYISLNDYDRDQVDSWLEANVLQKIDPKTTVSSQRACILVAQFLEEYAQSKPVSLISAGKLNDISLLFQLWHSVYPERKYFHFGRYLPKYLNHRAHFDLDTLFFAAGLSSNLNREDYIGESNKELKHSALYDAQVVRQCFIKLIKSGRLPYIAARTGKFIETND